MGRTSGWKAVGRSRSGIPGVVAAFLVALSGTFLGAPAGASESLPADVDRCPFSGKYPVEVLLESPMHLRWLGEWKLDVAQVRGLTATVHVTDTELAELQAAGFTARAVPNDARRAWQAFSEAPLREAYHTHATLTTELQAIAAAHPDITRLTSLGPSVQGRELWALKISDNPALDEAEPEFKYTATIHGDEPPGTEMSIYLIRLLVEQYGVDPEITALVDDLEIWFVPMHNPDGNAAGTRYNAQGYDLNRSFPDPRTDPIDDPAGRPHEVQLMMRWVYDHNFILGANYHTGALVVNYPWDTWYGQYTPDDTMIRNLALGYAVLNPPMYSNPEFPQGVVIGWEWYVISGGMQDWSYHWRNEAHFTIEMSNTKWPSSTALPGLWESNRESMLWLLAQSRIGVEGYVTDAQSGEPIQATIDVTQIGKEIWGEPTQGYYHRLLEPGTYTLEFGAFGYQPATASGVVVAAGATTHRDVQLQRTAWYTVSGTVTEEGTGAPLAADVAVLRHDTGALITSVATDPATGAYEIDVPAWEYDIAAAADGHAGGQETRLISGNTVVDFVLTPARGEVLVVRDSNTSQALGQALGDLGYLVTTEEATGTDPAAWDDYDLLVWSAGSANNPVANATLRSALETHVAAGAKLLIEGGELAYDACSNPGYPSFAANVLHASQWVADQSGHLQVAAGMSGHPLATTPNVLPGTIQLTYNNYGDQDACRARPEAEEVFAWASYPSDGAILVVDVPGRAEGQVVFYAFDYAALTSATVAAQLLENTVDYLTAGAQGVAGGEPSAALRLGPPMPAVTRGGATLRLALAAPERAAVRLYDAAGRCVRTLIEGDLPAGTHDVSWDGRDEGGRRSPAGVYFVRAAAGGLQLHQRLVKVE